MSEGVREFAETGATDTLEKEVAKDTIENEAAGNNFLDAIIAPPIEQGVGETSTNVFVDTNHSKVRFRLEFCDTPSLTYRTLNHVMNIFCQVLSLITIVFFSLNKRWSRQLSVLTSVKILSLI